MIFKFKHQLLGGHTHFQLFVGKSLDHTLALSGSFVLDEGLQTENFLSLIRRGSGDGGEVILEEVK